MKENKDSIAEKTNMKEIKNRNKKRKIHPFLKGFLGCMLVVGAIAVGVSFATASVFHGKLNYEKINSKQRTFEGRWCKKYSFDRKRFPFTG